MNDIARILHITDIHVDHDRSEEEILNEWQILMRQVLALEEVIHAIAVTGDLTSHADPAEFAIVGRLLDEALACCGLTREQIYICPGNHDADTPYEGSSFDHYEGFIQGYLLGERQNPTCPGLSGVQFCCVNTNTRTGLWGLQDNAYIPETEWKMIRSCADTTDYRIVLMHHEPEVIRNQNILRELCAQTDLILCGHLHPNRIVTQRMGRATVVTGLAVNPRPNEVSMGINLITVAKNNVQTLPLYLVER